MAFYLHDRNNNKGLEGDTVIIDYYNTREPHLQVCISLRETVVAAANCKVYEIMTMFFGVKNDGTIKRLRGKFKACRNANM